MSNYILKPLYFPEELPQYPFSNQDQNRFITLPVHLLPAVEKTLSQSID